MAGIGVTLTAAIVSDGEDIRRLKFSQITERGDSGMTLRRQAGRGERAIAGVPSTAEVHCVAEQITAADFEWLNSKLGLPVTLRLADFSANVVVRSVSRTKVFARSDTQAWGVQVVFYIIRRI